MRRALLDAAGLPVETAAAGIDERAIEAELTDREPMNLDLAPRLAARLAREKAIAVSARFTDRVVVGADQTLACAGRLFHKPPDSEAARLHLAELAGRTHTLHAAFVIARAGVVLAEGIEVARLSMRPLDAARIARYTDLAGEQAIVSVGAYQIENLGVHLFDRIEGEHSTILGLPMLRLLAALRTLGLLTL